MILFELAIKGRESGNELLLLLLLQLCLFSFILD
jgi:hypothetical protein